MAARKILAEFLRRFVIQTAARGPPFPRYNPCINRAHQRSEPGPDIGRVARYLVISSFFIESLPIASFLTASRPLSPCSWHPWLWCLCPLCLGT